MKLFLFPSIFLCNLLLGQTWQQVVSFGTNPASLNMYTFIPNGISGPVPLVLALHGCTQNASVYAAESGWDSLAQRNKFYVVFPEQVAANNSSLCFNWFLPANQSRNQGEPLSLMQMVSYMQANYNVDPTRIFITGLSAGACMTNIMLACYPDIFSKGASMSGAPYLSATSATQANNVMLGLVTNTSTNWASLVTGAYPSYSGSYPSIAIFHGSYDNVVSIVNENEMMKQWTAVHQLSQTPPQVENAFNGNVLVTQNRYFSSQDIPLVETYTISGMGHGIALDTGNCWGQCGKAGLYALDVYFNSTYWAAQFFGIISNSITISGPLTLASNSNGVTYSVSAIPGANYTWTVPQGYVITGGQGTFQIMINSGSQSGFISVRAVLGTGCSINSNDLFVTVSTANHIEPKSEIPLIVKQTASNTIIICSSEKRIVPIKIYNTLGNLCFASEVETNSEIRIPENISEGIYLIVLSNYAQKIWLNQ